MKNVLKEIRMNSGLSQEELSKKSGVSRITISNIESGKRDVITNITLEKLSKALDKKVSDIFFVD